MDKLQHQHHYGHGSWPYCRALQGGTLTVLVGGKSVYAARADKEPLTKGDDDVTLDGGAFNPSPQLSEARVERACPNCSGRDQVY